MRNYIVVFIVILFIIIGIAIYASRPSTPVQPGSLATSTVSSSTQSSTVPANGTAGRGASGVPTGSAGVSATIDAASLQSGSSAPILTGSASGLSTVYVEIDGTGKNLSTYGPGGASVVNGHWSLSVSPSTLFGGTYEQRGLPPGSYHVIVWSSLGLGSAQEMARGTLAVSGTVAPVPSVTHTQTNYAGSALTLSGTAENTNSVTVALVPASYSGSANWNAIVASSQFQHVTVPVSYTDGVGEWSASFKPSGRAYYPYIFEPGSHLLLSHGADGRDEIVLP